MAYGFARIRRGAVVRRHVGTIRLAVLLAVLATLAGWHLLQPNVPRLRSPEARLGYAQVIDGDTIDLAGTRIRLHGIDAPEATQTCTMGTQLYPCGHLATRALADLVRGQPIRCDPLGLDRYRRTVARCVIERTGQDIEAQMVRQGYAVAYTRFSYDYVADELVARAARRGIWADAFEWPWVYRGEARETPSFR
jgi:endonuclease YncB( thermonuclease family)